MARIGIFGGSFDPVHEGHLALARRALDVARLDRVVFVPAADSPFKIGRMAAPAAERVALLRRALAGEPRFEVSTFEIDRGGVSYSVETVEALRASSPPGTEFVFLIGADNLATLHAWHRARDLVKLCSFVSFGRAGTRIDPAALGFDPETNARLAAGYAGDFDCPVSSTDVRARLARGASVSGLVPREIEGALAASPSYGPKDCILVDAGNTSTTIGRWDGRAVSCVSAVRGGVRNPDEAAAALDAAGARHCGAAFLASVVPQDDARWTWLFDRLYGLPLEKLTHETPLPLAVDYPHPEQIGADRLCDAAGALARHGAPVAVADFGTALTFDVVDARGAYVGGIIAPGLPLMTGYLHEKTAKLPAVELAGEPPPWGDSTENAMKLGAKLGHRGMVREILDFVRSKTGPETAFCATGGYAAWALEGFPGVSIEPDLTLFGLGTIWNHARAKA